MLIIVDLFKKIETKSKNEFEAKQLKCISMLVYYCGIKRGEIPKLEVKDLIDKAGLVKLTITRFKKKKSIKLNCETSAAIQSYHCQYILLYKDDAGPPAEETHGQQLLFYHYWLALFLSSPKFITVLFNCSYLIFIDYIFRYFREK